MSSIVRTNLKRILSFALVASMVFSMDATYLVVDVQAATLNIEAKADEAKSEDAPLEEMISDESVSEEIIAEENTSEEIDATEISEEILTDEVRTSDDSATTDESATSDAAKVSDDEDLITEDLSGSYAYGYDRSTGKFDNSLLPTGFVEGTPIDGFVYFNEGTFRDYLSGSLGGIQIQDGNKQVMKYPSFANLKNKKDYHNDDKISGYVPVEDVNDITELIICTYPDWYYANDKYQSEKIMSKEDLEGMDLSELQKFPNLKSLSFIYDEYDYKDRTQNVHNYLNVNVSKVSNLTQLTKLHFEYCHFDGGLNIGNLTNLTDLEFVNSYYPNDNNSIAGLENLKKLKHFKIDESGVRFSYDTKATERIQGLQFATDGVQSDSLAINMKGCSFLETFSSGGYLIANDKTSADYKNMPSFYKSNSLTTLNIKGLCRSDKDVLDIRECDGLNNVTLAYRFENDDDILTINAEGNSRADGTLSVSRLAGSKNGHFSLSAFSNYYMNGYANAPANADLFSGVVEISDDVAYIAFEGDTAGRFSNKYKIEKWKPWEGLTYMATVGEGADERIVEKDKPIPNYVKNPMQVAVGGKISNIVPVFYNSNGIIVENKYVNYTVTIENDRVPEGKSTNSSIYKILTTDGSAKPTSCTATNPGLAYIRIDIKDKEDKKIVKTERWGVRVYAPIAELYTVQTANTPVINTVDGNKRIVITDPGKYNICTELVLEDEYKGLVDRVAVVDGNGYTTYRLSGIYDEIRNKLVEKVGENWKEYDTENRDVTPDGLSIASSTSNSIVKSDGSIVGGTYTVTTSDKIINTATLTVDANVSPGIYGIKAKAIRNDGCCKDNPVWAEKYLQIITINVGLSNNTIYYGYNNEGKNPSSAKIIPPDLEGYYSDENSIEVSAGKMYEDLFEAVPTINEANGHVTEWTIKFRDDITKAEIDKAIYDAGEYDPSISFDVTVKSESDSSFSKVYTKTIQFSCKNYITYDTDGGELSGEKNYSSDLKYYPDELVMPIHYNPTSRVIFKEPTKQHYVFDGWYDGEVNVTGFPNPDEKLGDLNLKAHWKPFDYSISYVLNGGENNPDNPTKYNIESDELPLKEPTRFDHTFAGWFLSKDATTPVSSIPTGSTGDITLYAKWNMNEGHTHTPAVDEYVAPTCQSAGKSAGTHCSTCNEILIAQKNIAALGHILDSGTVTKAPEAEVSGIMTYRCMRLNCNHTETKVIPSLSYSEDVVGEDSLILDNPNKPITETTINVMGINSENTYTGKAITFDLRVYVGKNLLKEGKDYSVKYVNNKNVPAKDAADNKKPAVIITGKGDYKDKTTYEFKPIYFNINPVNIEELDDTNNVVVSADVAVAAKRQKFVKPVPSIMIDGKKLSKKDYTVSYGEGKDSGIDISVVGKNAITLTAIGNYTGTLSTVYEVVDENAPLLSKATITGIEKTLPYRDGGVVRQSDYTVKLKLNKVNTELVENTDYLVKYVDNREIGTASMIIYAKPANANGIVGQKVINFKIGGTAMNKLVYTYLKKVDYTGATIKPGLEGQPELVLHDNTANKDLVYGTDYEVSYSKNVQAGTANMTITGMGVYTGTVKKTFKIVAVDLSKNEGISATLIPGSVEKQTEGKYKDKYTAKVKVSYNGRVLKEGKDYTVSYKNNAKAGSAADGNKAPQVIIKGKGNYAKSVIVPFDIVE